MERDTSYVMRDFSCDLVPDGESCKLVDALVEQNAKLRKLVVLQSVIFKHMSTCRTTDCQVCPVKEECAEFVHLEGILGIDDKETSWLVQWRNEDASDHLKSDEFTQQIYADDIKLFRLGN